MSDQEKHKGSFGGGENAPVSSAFDEAVKARQLAQEQKAEKSKPKGKDDKK